MKHASRDGSVEIKKKDYSKRIILSLQDFKEKGHLLQEVIIPPQTKQRLHKHFKQTEVWYITEGEASIFINDNEFFARAGDAFIADPGDVHGLWNKSDLPFKLIVFKLNMPEDNEDTQWLEE